MRRLFIFAALLLSSCVAIDTTARASSGVVVDAATGRPISGVSVIREISEKSQLVATTDASGRFAVAAARTAYVTIPMGDAFYSCSLVFRAPGYAEQRVDCGTGTGASHTAPIAGLTVKLRRKA